MYRSSISRCRGIPCTGLVFPCTGEVFLRTALVFPCTGEVFICTGVVFPGAEVFLVHE